MRARERKPPWLRLLCPDRNPAKLVAVKCDGCGLYVVEDRSGVWEKWDYGLVTGPDLLTAIVLGVPLALVEWPYGGMGPRLVRACGDHGFYPSGEYLAAHRCHYGRISVQPVKPPRKPRPPGKPWGRGLELTDEQTREFERIWNMPYRQLVKEDQ